MNPTAQRDQDIEALRFQVLMLRLGIRWALFLGGTGCVLALFCLVVISLVAGS